jgi:hypothetical protein
MMIECDKVIWSWIIPGSDLIFQSTKIAAEKSAAILKKWALNQV